MTEFKGDDYLNLSGEDKEKNFVTAWANIDGKIRHISTCLKSGEIYIDGEYVNISKQTLIYNRCLSADEVKKLSENNPVEHKSNAWKDISGNNNHGTLVN